MPFCAARWIVSRRLHATHTGGCGFCRGFGTTLRGGMVTYSPEYPVNGVSVRQRTATRRPSSHISRFCIGIDHEAAELRFRRRLAGAEVDATVRHEVERRDAFRDPRRVVERRRRLHDAVTEPDVLRALRRRARGTPRARSSGSTPRGSGARPPTRSGMPSLSASSICSSASWISWYSESSVQGRGNWCS